ncbi:hypothetical protein E0Z10_g6696 [Xylaria hypoxylon]|uniref:Uncharacterized protein n=1 Tax=Xylaria hypoxylon TaxID=37992 RepID=A0A4Z0YDL2_9PEZI|nr:hypothetical protein E0Z10_g6696 [Xylaria hypoxylon]
MNRFDKGAFYRSAIWRYVSEQHQHRRVPHKSNASELTFGDDRDYTTTSVWPVDYCCPAPAPVLGLGLDPAEEGGEVLDLPLQATKLELEFALVTLRTPYGTM